MFGETRYSDFICSKNMYLAKHTGIDALNIIGLLSLIAQTVFVSIALLEKNIIISWVAGNCCFLFQQLRCLGIMRERHGRDQRQLLKLDLAKTLGFHKVKPQNTILILYLFELLIRLHV